MRYPEPTGEVRVSLSLRFAAGSHDGMIRDHNEDSGYAGPRLLAAADGMGGQAAGEVASSQVISSLVQLDEDIPGSDLLTELGNAVQRANDQLRSMVEEDPQLEGMGTTLTALLWTGQRLGLVHVGDSRAYVLRGGELTQITQDHTWVQKLVDEGRITEEEATTHPQRSLLMRALGSGDHVEPDLSIREVRPGDRYLLCSDGLSGVVSHETLEETLVSHQDPNDAIQELIQLGLRGGGPDNITCIVADVLDVDASDAQLNDTPIVVGAVAESQHQLGGDERTPAARAAQLGKQGGPSQQSPHGQQSPRGQQATATPPEGGFGPPGSGTGPGTPPATGAFGPFTDEDLTKPGGGRRKWLKRSLLIALALAVVGAGVYAGWSWTQRQYYIGTKGNHLAVYQGLSQELAGISLHSVHKDHPDIELRYLPTYQRDRVRETIPADSLDEAKKKIAKLREQAEVCQEVAERKQDRKRKDERQPDLRNPEGKPEQPRDGGQDNPSPDRGAPSASPLSEKERDLAKQCTAP